MHLHQWQQSILTGSVSPFDAPEWLEIAPVPHHPRLSIDDSRRLFHLFTQLPRLTNLVRRLRADPSKTQLSIEAASLAEELFQLAWNVSVLGMLNQRLNTNCIALSKTFGTLHKAELFPRSTKRTLVSSLSPSPSLRSISSSSSARLTHLLAGSCSAVFSRFSTPVASHSPFHRCRSSTRKSELAQCSSA